MLHAFLRLAPSVVLLLVAVRVRAIQRAFRNAGATSPDHAVALRSLPVRAFGLPLRLLERRGVLVRTSGDRYFLDEAAAERWRRRRRIIVPIVLTALVLGLVVIFLSGAGRS